MKITTSKGKTFDVIWAWAPVGLFNDRLQIGYIDDRSILEIAKDFSDCDYIDRESEYEGNFHWTDYTELVGVYRDEFRKDNAVTVILRNPKG